MSNAWSKPIDIALLKELWPSPLTDRDLEIELGLCRGSFRRIASNIGLPPRGVARMRAYETGGRA
jgi:hypothetical protein